PKEIELFFQAELVRFDLRDDRLQALQRLLERRLFPRTSGHGSSCVSSGSKRPGEASAPSGVSAKSGPAGATAPVERTTVAISPSSRRTRTRSPIRTAEALRNALFEPSR